MLLSQLSRVALGEVSENLLELLLDLGLHYLSVFMLVRISGQVDLM